MIVGTSCYSVGTIGDFFFFASPKSDLHLGAVGRRALESRAMVVEAMPSVKKALVEV